MLASLQSWKFCLFALCSADKGVNGEMWEMSSVSFPMGNPGSSHLL